MSPFQAVCRSRLAPLLTAATLVLSSIPRPARADTEGPLSAVSETQEGPTGIGTPTTPGSAAPNGFAQASVDPSTGVLRVNIPFDLLKARGNVQPTLSLSYNSNGGRGYGGDGWDLNIPSIVRHALYGGPKYNDPAAGAPLSPGQEDRVSLATRQLVPICYIGNASCPSLPPHKPTVTDPFPIFVGPGWHYFRPEVDNGALLRAFWSPDHTRWVLQYGNGSISEYGAPSDNPSDLSGTDVDATTPYSI